jgi:hypothetical protein
VLTWTKEKRFLFLFFRACLQDVSVPYHPSQACYLVVMQLCLQGWQLALQICWDALRQSNPGI